MAHVDPLQPAGSRPAEPIAGSGGVDGVVAQQAYRAMLLRLCELVKVPPADHDVVLERNALIFGGELIVLHLEEWSSFVKIFIDVGKPSEADAAPLHRYLLSQQLFLPVPFSLVPAVHPETDHIMLCGYSPMPTNEAADEEFVAFLHGCVYVCETLRANSPQKLEPADIYA
jgi:hypothetical protein